MKWMFIDNLVTSSIIPFEVQSLSGEIIIERIELINGNSIDEFTSKRVLIPSQIISIHNIIEYILNFELILKFESPLTSGYIVTDIKDSDFDLLLQLKNILNDKYQFHSAQDFKSYIKEIKKIVADKIHLDHLYHFVLLFCEYYSNENLDNFSENCDAYIYKFSHLNIFKKYLDNFKLRSTNRNTYESNFNLYSFAQCGSRSGDTFIEFVNKLNFDSLKIIDASKKFNYSSKICSNTSIIFYGHGSQVNDTIGNENVNYSLKEILGYIDNSPSLTLLFCFSDDILFKDWKYKFPKIMKVNTGIGTHILNYVIYVIELESKRKLEIEEIFNSSKDICELLNNGPGEIIINK